MMRCHSATADARYVAVGACAVDQNFAYTICGCQTVNAVYPNHLLEQTASLHPLSGCYPGCQDDADVLDHCAIS